MLGLYLPSTLWYARVMTSIEVQAMPKALVGDPAGHSWKMPTVHCEMYVHGSQSKHFQFIHVIIWKILLPISELTGYKITSLQWQMTQYHGSKEWTISSDITANNLACCSTTFPRFFWIVFLLSLVWILCITNKQSSYMQWINPWILEHSRLMDRHKPLRWIWIFLVVT